MKTKKIAIILLSLMLLLQSLFCLPASASDEYATWKQSDSRWGSISFGSIGDTMAKSGCLTTSISILMVYSGAVSSDPAVFNPGIFCQWLKDNGGYTSQGWLYWAKVNQYTSSFSYVGEAALSGSQSDKAAQISAQIAAGNVVVTTVKSGGHYVAVKSVSGSTVTIMDPASPGHTNLFDYDESGVTTIHMYKGPTSGSGSVSVRYGTGVYQITSSNGVNMREGPGTGYSTVGSGIPNGIEATVTSVTDNWGQVTYNGLTGWICLDYATLISSVIPVSVTSLSLDPPAKTNYYADESLDLSGITLTAHYSDGTSADITSGYSASGFDSTPGAHTVTLSYEGQTASFDVTVYRRVVNNGPYYTGNYVITAMDGVNLRSSASASADRVGGISCNTQVEVTDISDDGNGTVWGYTASGESAGWFSLYYTEYINPIFTGIRAKSKYLYFLPGETVLPSAIIVYSCYSNGSETILSDGVAVSQEPFSSTGTNEVSVSYGQTTCLLQIAVNQVPTPGDCDRNGSVNTTDALIALRFAVGRAAPYSSYAVEGDADGDGKITTTDALLILRTGIGYHTILTPVS